MSTNHRGRDEEGNLFYECPCCGARTTRSGDVAMGRCALCDRFEIEAVAELGERLDEQRYFEFFEADTLERNRPAA